VYAALTSKELRENKDVATFTENNISSADDALASLKPQKTITTALCTEKFPTISIILPLQSKLLNSLMVQCVDDSGMVKEMKQTIISDLSER
jgi:hypothetical protein